MTTKQVIKTKRCLEVANLVEYKGHGFFARNSDNSMTIYIRGAHGNDSNQWINARAIEEALMPYCHSGIEIDKHAGLLFLNIKNVYTHK